MFKTRECDPCKQWAAAYNNPVTGLKVSINRAYRMRDAIVVQENLELARKYSVKRVPTFVLVDGSRISGLEITDMEHASELANQQSRSVALRLAWISGGLPLVAGSIAFIWWWISRDDLAILLGIAAVTAGPVLVLIGLICLILALRKRPRVSRKMILGAGLLLFSNFPIAWGYWNLVDAEVTTNRYRFINQTGVPVQQLVLSHRERQIGLCQQLDDGGSVEFFFSALNNGGEGPISFTGRQVQQSIGGETGVMAFVFTKSHVEIILQPNNRYRVRVQKFPKARPEGSIRETDWGGP